MSQPQQQPQPLSPGMHVRPGPMTSVCNRAAECVIEVGHKTGTPADWRSSKQPDLTVCDRHKGHYETAYDDYSHLEPWEPIERTYAQENPYA